MNILSLASSMANMPHTCFLSKATAEQYGTNSLCLLVCRIQASADVHERVSVCVHTHTWNGASSFEVLTQSAAGNGNLHGNQRANAKKMFSVGANVC